MFPYHAILPNKGTHWNKVQFYLKTKKQLLRLCTARIVLPILIAVQSYNVIPEKCRWLTKEKQTKTDIHLTSSNR